LHVQRGGAVAPLAAPHPEAPGGSGRSGGVDGVEPPLARDPLQLRAALVAERDPRAGDKVLHRLRDAHLARLGMRRDTGPDVNGDAADLAVEELALTRMDTGAKLQAKFGDGIGDRARALDRPRRAIGSREEACTGC